MAKGTVTWFSEQKGYGLISPDDRGKNIFVYYTDIVGSGFRSLKEGERVSYVPALAVVSADDPLLRASASLVNRLRDGVHRGIVQASA